MTVNDLDVIIKQILKPQEEPFTKEEAYKILRSCGILDGRGNIAEAYRDILHYKPAACIWFNEEIGCCLPNANLFVCTCNGDTNKCMWKTFYGGSLW